MARWNLLPVVLLPLVLTLVRGRIDWRDDDVSVLPRDDRSHVVWTAANYTYEAPQSHDRRLQSLYYYSAPASSLGAVNFDVTIGNPLKGLMGSPVYPNYDYNSNIQSSLEWFYVGLDYIMKGDPDVVGTDAAFDWTVLENRIKSAASRNKHVVFSVAAHYPGWEDLNIPQYLLDGGLKLHYYPDFLGGGYTPDYGDSKLLRAFELFIKALGAKYDGDQRIGFIHLGLLGFWGEWHTYPHDYVPDHARESLVKWYASSFQKTRLQARYPFASAHAAGYGLNDGSFTYETLGGEANGGVDRHYYFMNQVKAAGQEDGWKTAPRSGETRPENQAQVFKDWYARGTETKQDFMVCVNATHASMIFHNNAFDHRYEGTELANALFAHTRMGYNYVVRKVDVALSGTPNAVDVDVTVEQVGIAPFYYPLNLVLDCDDPVLAWPRAHTGVEGLIEQGASKVYRFSAIPSTYDCLRSISLILDSDHAYRGKPIKFAQGSTGVVTVNIPMPPDFIPLSTAQVPVASPPSIQLDYTLLQIKNRVTTSGMPVTDGTVIDLAEVGRDLSLRANVQPGKNIDVRFEFNDRRVLERSEPFTLLPGGAIVPYLGYTGQKSIRISVVNSASVVLRSHTLVFQVVDTTPKLL